MGVHYHPKIHGVAEHTDVTRTKFYRVAAVTSGAFTRHLSHAVAELDPDSTEYAIIEFMTPSDFVSFTSLKVVWFAPSDAGTIGKDWVCDPRCWYGADGEAPDLHKDAPAMTTIDVAAVDTIYVTDVGFTMTSLAKGDYVGCEIERQANNASDTWELDIYVVGVLLTYVAEQ